MSAKIHETAPLVLVIFCLRLSYSLQALFHSDCFFPRDLLKASSICCCSLRSGVDCSTYHAAKQFLSGSLKIVL